MKFRKKPVVIDAHLYTGDIEAAINWTYRLGNLDGKTFLDFNSLGELHVATLEGSMKVPKGNYIICGIKGELYSCEPNIFHMTYEEVND